MIYVVCGSRESTLCRHAEHHEEHLADVTKEHIASFQTEMQSCSWPSRSRRSRRGVQFGMHLSDVFTRSLSHSQHVYNESIMKRRISKRSRGFSPSRKVAAAHRGAGADVEARSSASIRAMFCACSASLSSRVRLRAVIWPSQPERCDFVCWQPCQLPPCPTTPNLQPATSAKPTPECKYAIAITRV